MSETMKNIVFTDVKTIQIEEHPIPLVTKDNILIRVDACGICTWEQRVYTGVKKVDFPFIGGHELAATIIDMGDNVDKREWKIGDTVVVGVNLACKNCIQCKSGNEQNCEHFDHSKQMEGLPHHGMGGLSSHMLVKPENLFHYHGITPQEATITEPLSCVTHSVETAQVQLGDTVVVIGCGIMGLLHVALSVKEGATVIASDMNEERLKLALSLGAKYTNNPSKEPLEEAVSRLTNGQKAQVVFDTTPIAKVARDAFKALSINGRLVLYSSFYPDEPISFSPDWVHKNAIKIMGTANSNTSDFVKATKMLSEKTIDVNCFISEVYSYKDVEKAFESAIKGDKYRVVIEF